MGSLGIVFADLIVSEPAGGGLAWTVQGLALANSKKTSAFSSMVEVWRGAKAGVSRSQLVPQVSMEKEQRVKYVGRSLPRKAAQKTVNP